VRYEYKYSFLFDLDYLKELEYYSIPIAWKVYKKIAKYIYENNPEYFDVLSSKSKIAKEIVEKYLYKERRGKVRVFFDFWRDEKNVFEWIMQYQNQKIVSTIVNNSLREFFVRYPYSVRSSKKFCLSEKIPEIISRKEVDLFKSPYFLGFYIEGNIPVEITKILANKYKGKILFDGKRIEVIK
jgi:mRNA-degrading endonuclease RelE of RelBE toxin-antitoxin system